MAQTIKTLKTALVYAALGAALFAAPALAGKNPIATGATLTPARLAAIKGSGNKDIVKAPLAMVYYLPINSIFGSEGPRSYIDPVIAFLPMPEHHKGH